MLICFNLLDYSKNLILNENLTCNVESNACARVRVCACPC